MFTMYIHIMEVLAMHGEGTTVRKIVDMGCEYTIGQIAYALRSLETEGYVIADKSGSVNIWQMTEKAIEYFSCVIRKYEASHVMDAIADYVASAEMGAQEAPTTAFALNQSDPENVVTDDTKQWSTEVFETPSLVNIELTKISFPLYGDKTIAEYVEEIESASNATVEKADLVNGIVTLTIQSVVVSDPDATHICEKCHAVLHTHEELYHLMCATCLWE